jgi:hypothetical protein
MSDVEMAEPVSPQVEEWAANHQRATVEDVDDEDEDEDMCGKGYRSFQFDEEPGEGLEGWENDWAEDDYVQAELDRELSELGKQILVVVCLFLRADDVAICRGHFAT